MLDVVLSVNKLTLQFISTKELLFKTIINYNHLLAPAIDDDFTSFPGCHACQTTQKDDVVVTCRLSCLGGCLSTSTTIGIANISDIEAVGADVLIGGRTIR